MRVESWAAGISRTHISTDQFRAPASGVVLTMKNTKLLGEGGEVFRRESARNLQDGSERRAEVKSLNMVLWIVERKGEHDRRVGPSVKCRVQAKGGCMVCQ